MVGTIPTQGPLSSLASSSNESLLYVLVRVSIAVTKHYDQNKLEEGGLFHLVCLGSQSIPGGSLERNLEADTDAEAMEKCYLLACSLGLLTLLSYSTQDHLHRDGTAHREWGPPTPPAINQENVPTCLPAAQYDGNISRLRLPQPGPHTCMQLELSISPQSPGTVSPSSPPSTSQTILRGGGSPRKHSCIHRLSTRAC